MNDKYWANSTGEELAKEIIGRLEQYSSQRFTGLHSDRVVATQRGYYGLGKNGAVSHMVSRGGVQGELSLVYTNYLRYLIQHAVSRISARRFSFEVPIEEATFSARQQSEIDTDTLEHFRQKVDLNKKYREALEKGYETGEGYFHICWDNSAGDVHTIDDQGMPVRTGDMKVTVGSFWNVVPFDIYDRDTEVKCYIELVNKYDLAAKYPARAEEILAAGADLFSSYIRRQYIFGFRPISYDEDSCVALIHFYHDRSPALPAGKEALVLGNGTWIYDGPLSYSRVPIIKFSPSEDPTTGLGYSPAFDAVGAIDAMNSLKSIAMSNQAAFGVQNIWVRDANNLGPADVRGGLRFITSIEKPEALQLTQTPAEIFNNIETYRRDAVQIMGLNDVALGVETTRLSGDAMDVLDDAVYNYTEGPRASATEFLQRAGELVLTTVNLNLAAPMQINITRGKKIAKQQITGDDISPKPVIRVELTDSALSSPKGKRKFATDMAASGIPLQKEEFIDAYVKGQSESITATSTKQLDTIYEENEIMTTRLINPPVNMFGDNPILHIAHNALVLADPISRSNPELVAVAEEHIQEHIMQYQWLQMNAPEVLNAMGVNPQIMAQQTAAQMRAAPDPIQQDAQASAPNEAEAEQAPPPSQPQG